MLAAPGLIGIYVKILILYINHSIYRCAMCKRKMSWEVKFESLTSICMWSAVIGGGVEFWLGKKKDLLILQGFSWYALHRIYILVQNDTVHKGTSKHNKTFEKRTHFEVQVSPSFLLKLVHYT